MYTPTTEHHSLYGRDDTANPSILSRQNVIIIAVSSGIVGLAVVYFAYRALRNCMRSADSTPLPPVQPLAHHREQRLARLEESLASRPQTWFHPAPPATHSIGSKTSLLGSHSPVLSPTSTASPVPSSSQELELSSPTHLPLPSPSYNADSSSSINDTSETSCLPVTAEAPSPPALPRSIAELRSSQRRVRPLSTSSIGSFNSRTSRNTIRGAPHSPYSGVQIILPTPLASANNSRESLAPNDSRYTSYGRRSVADPWLAIESSTDSGRHSPDPSEDSHLNSTRRRRRPASLSSLRSEIIVQDRPIIPPVPQLPSNLEAAQQPPRRTPSELRWIPSHETLREEHAETDFKKTNKLEKKKRRESRTS